MGVLKSTPISYLHILGHTLEQGSDEMDSLCSVIALFPPDLAKAIQDLPEKERDIIEEIRVYRGLPLTIKTDAKEYRILPNRTVTAQDIDHIIFSATGGSFHSAAETIKRGYLTVKGGGRIGLCGEGSMQDGKNMTLRHISSLCVRVPKAAYGCADELLDVLCSDVFQNTLIISPPGMGKTTLLREMIRCLSHKGYHISVADERGEIGAVFQGIPQYDLGPHTDIISNVTKCEAGIMLIRSMAPDILAMDEITAIADLPAILEAAGCGVGLLATVHGSDVDSLRQKKMFRELFSYEIFEKTVCIEIEQGRRRYKVMEL